MRLLPFIASAIATTSLVVVLNTQLSIGTTKSPKLGYFLSPQHGFWKNAESKNGPQLNNIRHSSLSAEVEIVYDKRLVPHIFAKSDNDAFFAQGYVTAALRLWQMEFQTHAVAGRLAEFLGTSEERR
jgi:penicillin amidase